jgi:hypothetical protein
MKTYVFNVTVMIDDTNKNAPSFNEVKMAVEECINTPDNKHYGITNYEVVGMEI